MNKVKYYSCGMENSYRRQLFIFRARSEKQLIKRIKRQETFGWYYDGVLCPLKEIDYNRARELINVGAYYIWR